VPDIGDQRGGVEHLTVAFDLLAAAGAQRMQHRDAHGLLLLPAQCGLGGITGSGAGLVVVVGPGERAQPKADDSTKQRDRSRHEHLLRAPVQG
jgi:hypothetical protein